MKPSEELIEKVGKKNSATNRYASVINKGVDVTVPLKDLSIESKTIRELSKGIDTALLEKEKSAGVNKEQFRGYSGVPGTMSHTYTENDQYRDTFEYKMARSKDPELNYLFYARKFFDDQNLQNALDLAAVATQVDEKNIDNKTAELIKTIEPVLSKFLALIEDSEMSSFMVSTAYNTSLYDEVCKVWGEKHPTTFLGKALTKSSTKSDDNPKNIYIEAVKDFMEKPGFHTWSKLNEYRKSSDFINSTSDKKTVFKLDEQVKLMLNNFITKFPQAANEPTKKQEVSNSNNNKIN